ncbi:GDSL-type esterase/lipase family protein [uncultured Sphingomonas sp.]|uniref:GDSL-type esterase/lipase family protein n=1 Tax=uncultured Sphingomonas sp. TaxID=158754 RepID=UPI002616C50C|nr:GDSL-type esterase/lipase family protein [uncultured Sphingomonas sp.]
MPVNLDRILPTAAPLLRRMLRSEQAQRERQFAAMPRTTGRVVFLGDSITEWTAWEDWFPDLAATNRGIGGQAVGDVQRRLDSAIVDPVAVSLLIGTNDLHGLGRSTGIDDIADQCRTLVGTIRAMAPNACLLVNSVMPRSTRFRDRIVALNAQYRDIATANDATYVDVFSALADRDGAIRRDLTDDGLHLSVAGYAAWVEVLRPHLTRFARTGNMPGVSN